MMKRNNTHKLLVFIPIAFYVTCHSLYAVNDTISRNVTIERDYKAMIQPAQKINVQPKSIEYKQKKQKISLADSSYTLQFQPSVQSIIPPKENFDSPDKDSYGHIGVRGGVHDTYLDFLYRIKDKQQKSSLDIFVHHKGEWGSKSLSWSNLGLIFNKDLYNSTLSFGLSGSNDFYTFYGRYYDEIKRDYTINRLNELSSNDKRSVWRLNTYVGFKSKKWNEFQYNIQLNYDLMHYPNVSEHIIKTQGMIGWRGDIHGGGINVVIENEFAKLEKDYLIAAGDNVTRHTFRIEPFYSISANRFYAHFGVNLDLNLGSGNMLSGNNNVSFAPSPNINFEVFISKTWLSFYVNAIGKFNNPFLNKKIYQTKPINDLALLLSKHVREYTPIDGTAGFKIKAHRNLLLDLHIGYALFKNQMALYATKYDSTDINYNPLRHWGDFLDFGFMDYTRFKAGLTMSYHYKNIVNITLNADYYALKRKRIDMPLDSTYAESNTVYDRPDWEISLLGNFTIAKNWIVNTEARFMSSRKTLICDSIYPTIPRDYMSPINVNNRHYAERKLKPIIMIDLGVTYQWKRYNLDFFLEFENLINRENMLFYTFITHHLEVFAGVTWRF